MAVQAVKRLFTVSEYYQMAQAGIFSEDDHVELLEGEIIQMSPIGSRHAACVDRLARLFFERVGRQVIVRVQNPVRLSDYSEPQPDLALLKPRADFYSSEHPKPQDVLLVIEVCETSAEFDRSVKLPLYAQAGIPEVWLVDLSHERIEVHRKPSAQAYGYTLIVGRGAALTIESVPEIELQVEEILG